MADLLTAPLPEVWYGRPIDPDFRLMVRLASAYAHGELDGEHPAAGLGVLEQFYRQPVPSQDAAGAYQAMVEFFRAGETAAQADAGTEGSGTLEPSFDYRQDAAYIVAAFQQAYGMDLTREKVHWFRFRALFAALPEDTLFARIIGWRTMALEDCPAELRDHYRELRQRFALPPELRGGAAGAVSLQDHDAAFLARFRRR